MQILFIEDQIDIFCKHDNISKKKLIYVPAKTLKMSYDVFMKSTKHKFI